MNKVLNDLYDYGLKIYQDCDGFKFSLDSILLAEAVKLKKNDVLLDFCCGTAPVLLILSTKYSNKMYGIELQKEICDLARENIEINNLESQISIINDNIKNSLNYFLGNNLDVITCNPPFFKVNDTALINKNLTKAISRHELAASLEDYINMAYKLLKSNGTLYFIYRVERLQELFCYLSNYSFSVKELIFFKTNEAKNEITMVLIKAVKNGNIGLKTRVVETYRNLSYKNII